jgi:ATP-dependent DNA helicase DinG
MAGRIYVAIDLETTGLDANRDAIIEIGAVRFQDDVILERFSTLINPRRPIPARIQQITGIHDADVADAPTIDAVLPELRAFVSADVAAIVAHNAQFDLGFLRSQGVHFHRPALDTLELANVLLPGQASYSLGELCHTFGIDLVEAHRALDDALATTHLFMHLGQRLKNLPPLVIDTILASAGESDWPPLSLFASASASSSASASASAFASPHSLLPAVAPQRFEASDTLLTDTGPAPAAVSIDLLQTVFAPGGPLAQLMGEHFEVRAGQVDMALRVLNTINNGDHLMVEAGTGTGKSLAYLLPAALWSVTNQRRVVIATNTIALQDQLLDKDIPQVQTLVESLGFPRPQAALLKGRGNYLCLRRLNTWRANRQLSPAELSVLARVLVWLPTTQSGDVNELALPSAGDRDIWQQICSDSATCSPERCGAHGDAYSGSRDLDFFYLAHRRAETAHLLVVNHALLLADIAAGGRVLPAYTHLVVDEAHHLEEAATDQLTYRVDWIWVQTLLKRLTGDGDLVTQIVQFADRRGLPAARDQTIAISARVGRCVNSLRAFADQLRSFTLQQDDVRNDSGYVQRLPLDGRMRSQPQWSQVEIEWDQASRPLVALLESIGGLVSTLEGARWGESEPTATTLSDLTGAQARLQELAARMDEIVLAPSGVTHHGQVNWLEINEQRSAVALAAAPLHVSDVLQNELLHRRRSVIFTGATLRTGANFRFIRERLGLWDVSTAIVDSPFDFKRSTLIFLPSDLMAPNHPAYQGGVERALLQAAEANDGRTLALFTSYAQLRTTADAIRSPLERMGVNLYEQGMSSRRRLLREFRAAERAVLLGTRSFWEGIDLPGDELRCLLIVRLPFAVPNDPLVAARSAECDDPFNEYTLPDAILRFRQGFGRLIRRKTDRGVVILLDNRIWRKGYGQSFLDALPTCTVRNAPLSILSSEVQRWLAR